LSRSNCLKCLNYNNKKYLQRFLKDVILAFGDIQHLQWIWFRFKKYEFNLTKRKVNKIYKKYHNLDTVKKYFKRSKKEIFFDKPLFISYTDFSRINDKKKGK
jgi:hypothetical protein